MIKEKKFDNQQEKKEKDLPLGTSLGTRSSSRVGTRSSSRGRTLQRNMPVKVDNHPADTFKFDEDDYFALWERFKIKATNREHQNLKELGMLFEVWVKIKFGRLLE